MKKFKVALDEQEIRKCADEIKLYKSNLELAIKRNIRGIAMWAADVAQDAFGNSVVVDFEPIDDEGYSYRIIAEGADGRAVGFLEFGAGRLADASHPFAEEAPFPVGEAEYSVLNAQQYYRWGYWFFNGKKMYYVKPRRGLFEASEFIRDSASKLKERLSAVE